MSKKQLAETEELAPQWQAAGSLVPAEIAEEIKKISGEKPIYLKGKTKELKQGQYQEAENGTGQVITPQNKWTDIPSSPTKNNGTKDLDSISKENGGYSENVESKDDQNRTLAYKSGKSESYRVKKGDTLMKIAFEKYGNLLRWREIFETNKNQLKSYNFLVPGMTLTVEGVEYVVIEKNGNPYLIQKGDSLSKISKGVYGDSHYWRDLWFNNKQLIHNPNKIYYGFTIYYRPFEDLKKIDRRFPAETK